MKTFKILIITAIAITMTLSVGITQVLTAPQQTHISEEHKFIKMDFEYFTYLDDKPIEESSTVLIHNNTLELYIGGIFMYNLKVVKPFYDNKDGQVKLDAEGSDGGIIQYTFYLNEIGVCYKMNANGGTMLSHSLNKSIQYGK